MHLGTGPSPADTGPIITRTAPLWQQQLAEAVSRVDELLEILGLPQQILGATEAARAGARQFPLRVPREFVARMRPGDPLDPLLLQVLPVAAEMAPQAGFTADPLVETLVETPTRPAPGLLHKYHGRALLMVTGACGVHCRYCFRRHFPYGETVPKRDDWSETIAYLRSQEDLTEIILSGGDPLAASDRRLQELVHRLDSVPQLRRLRIHTRMPVVLPERVDDGLLSWLTGTRLSPVVVIHANHAQEIDSSVVAAMGRLRNAGVTVLNQTVLLRGVNDSVEALQALSEALFEAGVMPYYLHLLDKVQGAAHFDLPEPQAIALAAELARRLPGYLVPRLVREIPGAPAKVPVDLAVALQEPSSAP